MAGQACRWQSTACSRSASATARLSADSLCKHIFCSAWVVSLSNALSSLCLQEHCSSHFLQHPRMAGLQANMESSKAAAAHTWSGTMSFSWSNSPSAPSSAASKASRTGSGFSACWCRDLLWLSCTLCRCWPQHPEALIAAYSMAGSCLLLLLLCVLCMPCQQADPG